MRELTKWEFGGRTTSARGALIAFPVAAFLASGCGIGKLDRGSRKDVNTASAQVQAVSDAYKKKMGTVAALPKGGPGSGAPPKRSAPPPNVDAKAAVDTSAGGKSLRARVVSIFKGPKRKRQPGEEEQKPSMIRGRYAQSDSGEFFVPCNDTTRYRVQATVEARYLMDERLRFIVRSPKTPVYAVFTGKYVLPNPQASADAAPRAGSRNGAGRSRPAATNPAPEGKSVFISKVDTLTTAFPPACRPPSSNRSAGD